MPMNHRFAFCASCLLFASGSAFAQAENPTGFSFAFGYGPSTIEDEDSPTDQFDGSDAGWNFDAEWRFHEYVAIGMNIATLGEDSDFFNGDDTTIEVNGLGFYIRGYWPVSDRLLLHGTLGRFAYDADVDPGPSGFLFDGDANTFGFGADYRLSDQWSLRLDQRWFDGGNAEAGTLTTIGIRWQY